MKKVLITGAEGMVGTVLRAGLSPHYAITAVTRTPQAFASKVADIRDLADMAALCAGHDAVIHLAGAVDLAAGWEETLQHSMIGARTVFEAARSAGTRTLVYASSLHVLGGHEDQAGPELYTLDDPRVFDESAAIRPNSLYAVAKLFGENLGRHYAEHHGLRVRCVRIGTILAGDDPTLPGIPGRGRSASLPWPERYARIRAKWLSHRDCCQLFARCLEAKNPPWLAVVGTSDNPRQAWSLRETRRLVGYSPQDAAPAALPPEPPGS